jgi:hypothetical protein
MAGAHLFQGRGKCGYCSYKTYSSDIMDTVCIHCGCCSKHASSTCASSPIPLGEYKTHVFTGQGRCGYCSYTGYSGLGHDTICIHCGCCSKHASSKCAGSAVWNKEELANNGVHSISESRANASSRNEWLQTLAWQNSRVFKKWKAVNYQSHYHLKYLN